MSATGPSNRPPASLIFSSTSSSGFARLRPPAVSNLTEPGTGAAESADTTTSDDAAPSSKNTTAINVSHGLSMSASTSYPSAAA